MSIEKQHVIEEYPAFSTWSWTNYDGIDVNLSEWIEKHKEDDYFFIGTDSKNDRKCIYTSAVVAYKKSRGGSIIIHRDKVAYTESIRKRLILEAMRSLECAWHFEKYISRHSNISIHLDVNPNLHYMSSKYKEEMVSLIATQGFEVVHKPDSWAATKIAHNRCK